MFRKLLLLFILIPAVELLLLIKIGTWMGFWPTALLIVGTGVAGSYLARREGLQTMQRIQATLASGRLPGAELIDGALVLVSGAFLLTPGILTDIAGFLGLLPPTRALLRRYVQARLAASIRSGQIRIVTPGTGFSPGSARPVEEADWEFVS